MLLKSLKITVLASLFLAIFSSCSADEVLEEEGPKSKINNGLKQRLIASADADAYAVLFQRQIEWYQDFNPTTCNIDAMLLAFEVFDANGNPLNLISIFPWDASQGSFQSAVDNMVSILNNDFQQQVTIVFRSGILAKINPANNTSQIAQIDSYTLFLDYFDNCQSPDVVFQNYNSTGYIWTLLPPEPTSPILFPEVGCWSLVFPFQVLVVNDAPDAQPYQVSINSVNEFLDFFVNNPSNLIIIDFVYPITLVKSDGTQITVNNIQQLEQVFEQPCN